VCKLHAQLGDGRAWVDPVTGQVTASS